jgi:hypothetical protein
MNDTFDAAALNGPNSDQISERKQFFGLVREKYSFKYDDSTKSQS